MSPNENTLRQPHQLPTPKYMNRSLHKRVSILETSTLLDPGHKKPIDIVTVVELFVLRTKSIVLFRLLRLGFPKNVTYIERSYPRHPLPSLSSQGLAIVVFPRASPYQAFKTDTLPIQKQKKQYTPGDRRRTRIYTRQSQDRRGRVDTKPCGGETHEGKYSKSYCFETRSSPTLQQYCRSLPTLNG